MSLVVNTNVASMNAQRALMHSSRELQTAMERLSTGKKINSAADDAAGFAIAESMTAQIRGLSMAAKNAGDGLSLLKVVENATNDVTDMLQRIRELAVQAKSDTNSSDDVANLQLEADALIEEIGRVSNSTTYNGVAYIGAEADDISIQVGYNDNDTITLTTKSVHSDNLGTEGGEKLSTAAQDSSEGQVHIASALNVSIDDLSIDDEVTVSYGELTASYTYQEDDTLADVVTGLSSAIADVDGFGFGIELDDDETGVVITTTDPEELVVNNDTFSLVADDAWAHDQVGASPSDETAATFLSINSENALKVISDAIDQVASYKADWGAGQNRLEYTVSNLMNVVEFTSAARSRIQDADFAVEAANLAKAQVLQQTGTAMLAQANAAPQLALQLLK